MTYYKQDALRLATQLATAQAEIERLREYKELIDFLRRDEGDALTIVADNVEVFGPNNIVIYQGSRLGDWDSQTFDGDSIIECLRKARQALSAKEG